ncbi:MAG: type II secretion system protein GspF [Acidobacteria bacterium]|nr:type II secretion system protein GspF [Acidobacteriota bacterium]
MATFHYKALATDGRTRAGTLVVDDDRAAVRELRRQGLTPVFVGAEKQRSFELSFGGKKKAKASDVLHFTQEVATLLNAGVPLDRALEITSELTEQARFKTVVQDLQRTLRGGRSFGDTLAGHPEVFSELYVNMVRAGEVSGSLPVVMDRLAEFERQRDELRGYIISSLTYPALLVTVGSISIFILLRFVIPRFAEAFTSSNIPMPLPMEILLTISSLVQTWGVPVIVLLAAGAAALRTWTRTPEGRLKWDAFRLKIPVLGQALLKADVSRFARAMGTLVANTVPLVQAITITKGILANKVLSNALDVVIKGVKRGEGVAGPIKKAGVFPSLAGHLLTVGEETGRLDEMFHRMADIYEKDTREAIKRFTALFEPIVILVLGVVVGAMILSVMLAITSINQLGM